MHPRRPADAGHAVRPAVCGGAAAGSDPRRRLSVGGLTRGVAGSLPTPRRGAVPGLSSQVFDGNSRTVLRRCRRCYSGSPIA